ncbi:hypothetical protein ABMA27_014648 [Loxostege sticticalis]|uniref:CCHC-type domain-containing protein n=1 Tax=Loxostege sticticalis TaxID=481309 RepID=A0ABR3I9Q4_LOXSC
MEEPHDPGGTTPSVGHYVTITDFPGMDTEGSITDASDSNASSSQRKRKSAKICKHCSKRRRRHQKTSVFNPLNEFECQCSVNSDNVLRDSNMTFVPPPPTVKKPKENLSNNPAVNSLTGNLPMENVSNNPVARPSYVASDLAPYVVHIQKVSSEPNENLTVHPVTFGFFLKKNGIKNIIDGSLKKIGRNHANSFIDCGALKVNNYKAFIPTFNVTRMGVVRGVPTEWSEEDIVNNISVPIGCGKILKARRLKRKTIINGTAQFNPIETVVLTFDGQVLPKRVFLCFNSLPVDLYIYPTIQCYHCCRYGHVKNQCRSTPRCYKCGLGHSGESCSVEEESITCCLCSGPHMANSKACPEFTRQRNIKESMAKNCITYAEALKMHPPCSKSYADVLASSPPQNSSFSLNIDSSNNHTGKTSYKKTVFLKPRTPPRLTKGYDRSAHEDIVKGFNTPITPSKSILINSDEKVLNNLSIKELLITLINSLSQTNLISLPSNAAHLTETLMTNTLQNETEVYSDSVELP